MREVAEVAAAMRHGFASFGEACAYVRRQMPGETAQVVDGVAWELTNRVRYAEDLTPGQRRCFARVRVREAFHHLAGPYAVGYVVSVFSHVNWSGTAATAVFERASAGLVESDQVGQCGLDLPFRCLETIDR